jgi:hypothetical protein
MSYDALYITLYINSLIGALLVTFLMYLDKYEKESVIFVAKVFFFSIIFTCIYGILKSLFFTFEESWVSPLFFAPVTEELFKFSFLFYLIKRHKKQVDESFDAIVYIGIIAVGFSLYENIHYYMYYTQEGATLSYFTGNPLYYTEALKTIFWARLIPAHELIDISAVIIIGYGINKGKLLKRFLRALHIAIILHFGWNFIAIVYPNFIYYYALFLTVTAFISVRYLLKISCFKDSKAFEYDENGLTKKERYDWMYYIQVYILLVIVGLIGMVAAYMLQLFAGR